MRCRSPGGIGDARRGGAALRRGVQIGTAFLFCPESKILPPHRAALKQARDDATALTNVMTGRAARGFINRVMRELGPISEIAPEFPLAGGALAPLHAKAQAQGSGEFSAMWAGQAASLGREMPAGELTAKLATETQALLRRMAGHLMSDLSENRFHFSDHALASGASGSYITGIRHADSP